MTASSLLLIMRCTCHKFKQILIPCVCVYVCGFLLVFLKVLFSPLHRHIQRQSYWSSREEERSLHNHCTNGCDSSKWLRFSLQSFFLSLYASVTCVLPSTDFSVILLASLLLILLCFVNQWPHVYIFNHLSHLTCKSQSLHVHSLFYLNHWWTRDKRLLLLLLLPADAAIAFAHLWSFTFFFRWNTHTQVLMCLLPSRDVSLRDKLVIVAAGWSCLISSPLMHPCALPSSFSLPRLIVYIIF